MSLTTIMMYYSMTMIKYSVEFQTHKLC